MNLGGSNYTVDAACGSSLAAAALAVRELETGAADMVILGGVDTVQNPFTYLAFSKTQAFSPRGRCRPFDASADGIVISEGVAALVLKRLADAERDGDRIYAVIKGVGASSDGRARGLTAPVVEGQMRALERAYAKAGVSPSTVGYVEAHGTGTALGDVVEIEALGRLFQNAGASPGDCVVGSVKSSIGHTKCAAGLAGLINASLTLYHKVLPPTIGIETPNPKLDLRDGPFRLCTEARPWLHSARRSAAPRRRQRVRLRRHQLPRRARGLRPERRVRAVRRLPRLARRALGLAGRIRRQARRAARRARCLARSRRAGPISATCRTHSFEPGKAARPGPLQPATLAWPSSPRRTTTCAKNSGSRRAAIAQGKPSLEDPRGVFFEASASLVRRTGGLSLPRPGRPVAGHASRAGRRLSRSTAGVRGVRPRARGRGVPPVGPLVFPPPAFSEAEREDARRRLMETDVAQPAIGRGLPGDASPACAASAASRALLGGHSFGELVALHAAGVFDAARPGRALQRARPLDERSRRRPAPVRWRPCEPGLPMSIVSSAKFPGSWPPTGTVPAQTVIAGPAAAVDQAIDLAAEPRNLRPALAGLERVPHADGRRRPRAV